MEWKLVPVKPTGNMCHAVYKRTVDGLFPHSEYRTMLAAAPDPTQDEALVETVAKIISGAPFPSKQSLAKARAVLATLNGG